MTKDKKQSVSHFTEEQLTPKQNPSHSYTEGMGIEPLTPLEQKFADAKANRDAGVEPYVMVPVELWKEVTIFVAQTLRYEAAKAASSFAEINNYVAEHPLYQKMKQL